MSLLIKCISISLLFFVGAATAFAKQDLSSESGRARPEGDYPAGASLAAHHAGSHHEDNAPWLIQGDAVPASHQREVHPESSARRDEVKLSTEQRRALRQEIREVGRDLYRRK